MSKTLKQKTSDAMSKYVRLRDALEYCKSWGIDFRQFVDVKELPCKCCDCNEVRAWIRMDAGHYIGRGQGGGSGVYFDERNVHAQAKTCNAFGGKNVLGYRVYMLYRYGPEVLDELEIKDKTNLYKARDLLGLKMYYEEEYKKLVRKFERLKNGNRI